MKWWEALNAANKCREAAMRSKNEKFQELWHNIADKLEAKVVGQPWLRTYDGKFE